MLFFDDVLEYLFFYWVAFLFTGTEEFFIY